MEIKDSLVITDATILGNSAIIAPKELITMFVAFTQALENYKLEEADVIKQLILNYIIEHPKNVCVIKNLGVPNGEGKETTDSKRDTSFRTKG